MPKTTLYYFPVKALGEGLRMLLSYGGVDFEDKRVPAEDWPAFKPKTKYGQMPVLEIDGKQLAQAFAIARYLGRKHGLSGATPEEDYEIDEHMDYLNDLRAKAISVHYEEDEAVKERRHKDFAANLYPAMLTKLNEIIGANNGHLAIKKLTWADFMVAGMFDYLKLMMRIPDLEVKYPAFKKLLDNVHSQPKLKAYLAKAPKLDW